MNVKKILCFTFFCMVLSAMQPLQGAQCNFSTPKVAVAAVACFLAGALTQGGIDNHNALNIPTRVMSKYLYLDDDRDDEEEDECEHPSIFERVGFFLNGFFDIEKNAKRKTEEIKSVFGWGLSAREKHKKSLWNRCKIVLGRMKDFDKKNKPLKYGILLAAAILTVHILDKCGKFDSAPQLQPVVQEEHGQVGKGVGQDVSQAPLPGFMQSHFAAPRPAAVSVGTSPIPVPRPAGVSVAVGTSPQPVKTATALLSAQHEASFAPCLSAQVGAAPRATPVAPPASVAAHHLRGSAPSSAVPAEKKPAEPTRAAPCLCMSARAAVAPQAGAAGQQAEIHIESESKSNAKSWMDFFKVIKGLGSGLGKILESILKYFNRGSTEDH